MDENLAQARDCRMRVGMMLMGLLLFGSACTAFADYVVVANKSVSAEAISKSDAQSIFLGEKTKWDDGKPIEFAIFDSDLQRQFLQDVVGKSPSQFDSYWKRLVFTGKGSAPKTFSDAQKLLQYVAEHPGAVGYVPAGKVDASVKTISIK